MVGPARACDVSYQRSWHSGIYKPSLRPFSGTLSIKTSISGFHGEQSSSLNVPYYMEITLERYREHRKKNENTFPQEERVDNILYCDRYVESELDTGK